MRFSLVLLAILSTPSLAQQISKDATEQVKTAMINAVRSGHAAGAMCLVVKDGEEVLFEKVGVRDLDSGAPMTPDTLLRIYSMTKPITSVAAMKLFEQGKFQLDDPISKFIPAFERSTVFVEEGGEHKLVPSKRPITIRDAFCHTTGYGYDAKGKPALNEYYKKERMLYLDPLEMMPPEMTIAEAADALARIPAFHHPGEKFTYGYSTDLLGRLIEIWSGKTLDVYMQEAVFDPLEMVDTGFSIPTDKRNRFAACHTTTDDKLGIIDPAGTSPFNDGFKFLSGGGGLVSSIRDYQNFCQMMVDRGAFKGKRILKEETIKLMFTDQLEGIAGGFRFGLGFAINDVKLGSGDGQRTARQYSWGGYASTDFRLVPDERLFQIVMRQHVPSSDQLAKIIIPRVYAGIK